ncbi:hypothetical protein K5D39_25195, partial [Pseudomonas cichorii]|nr:hypothetical protein [Pseudomonas cichorii]
ADSASYCPLVDDIATGGGQGHIAAIQDAARLITSSAPKITIDRLLCTVARLQNTATDCGIAVQEPAL